MYAISWILLIPRQFGNPRSIVYYSGENVWMLMKLIKELERDGGKDTFVVLQYVLTREMGVITRNKTGSNCFRRSLLMFSRAIGYKAKVVITEGRDRKPKLYLPGH